jgi:hypothetical protein
MCAMPNNSASRRYRMSVKARAAMTTCKVVFIRSKAITMQEAS